MHLPPHCPAYTSVFAPPCALNPPPGRCLIYTTHLLPCSVACLLAYLLHVRLPPSPPLSDDDACVDEMGSECFECSNPFAAPNAGGCQAKAAGTPCDGGAKECTAEGACVVG